MDKRSPIESGMTREGDLEIPIKSGMTRYDEEGDLGRSPVRPRRTRNDLGRSSIEAGTTREGDLGRDKAKGALAVSAECRFVWCRPTLGFCNRLDIKLLQEWHVG